MILQAAPVLHYLVMLGKVKRTVLLQDVGVQVCAFRRTVRDHLEPDQEGEIMQSTEDKCSRQTPTSPTAHCPRIVSYGILNKETTKDLADFIRPKPFFPYLKHFTRDFSITYIQYITVSNHHYNESKTVINVIISICVGL